MGTPDIPKIIKKDKERLENKEGEGGTLGEI